MKQLLTIISLSGLILAGCTSTGSLSGTDDVYANPVEERMLAQKAREEQARKEALERQAEEGRVAMENEDAANPYYKDPEFEADDYYDYEYASRINRFHRPLPGAGYYDPFYTNMYTYSHNPAFWGTSIYNGIGMPSTTFGMYSMGISSGWGYNPGMSFGMGMGYNSGCYSGYGMYNPYYYDPFCYNTGFYDPWGYSSFSRGYNIGYYNGMYNSGMYGMPWGGYFNKSDPNSGYSKVQYGPRGSSGAAGNRSPRETRAGVISEGSMRQRYIENVAQEQSQSPRFTERRSTSRRIYQEGSAPNQQEQGRIQGKQGTQQSASPARTPSSGRRSNAGRIYQQPRQQQPQQQQQQQRQQNTNRGNSTWNQAPSNSGSSGRGSSTPRGSSGNNRSPRR